MLLTSQYSKAKGKQWLHHCAGLDTAKTNQANSQYNAKERVLTGCSLLACLTWEEGLLNTESMTALHRSVDGKRVLLSLLGYCNLG